MARAAPVALLLFALTAAAFAGAVGGGFLLLDDTLYVGNEVVQGGLTWGGARLALTRSFAANWHPLTWLSLMLDAELFGTDPRGYHLVNVLLHATNAALFFLLLARLTGRLRTSALAAALFAVHPLRVESVAWVSERKDVLALCLGLLALLAYDRYARRAGVARHVAVTVALALGLMAKATLVVWPLLMLVLDAWPLGRLPLARADRPRLLRAAAALVREKLPWVALCAAASFFTYFAQAHGGTVTFDAQPLGFRLTNAAWALTAYLRAAVWPADLVSYYPFRERALSDPAVLGSLLAATAVTLLVVRRARRAPWLAAGWCWYLAALVPVIGLVPIGSHAMADRYTYVPLLGPVIALCWALPGGRAALPGGRRGAAAAAAVAVAVLAAMARAQTAHWKDDVTFFTRLNALVPDNPVGYNALGYVQVRAGRHDEAERLFLESLRRNPRYYQAHLFLARLYQGTGRAAEAREHYRRALELDGRDASVQSTLGLLLLEDGKPAEALRHLEAVVFLEPELAEAHNNLGVALARLGRTAEAAAHFERAVGIDPAFHEARANLEALAGPGARP